MLLDELLNRKLVAEGLTHIEDLSLDDFLDAVKNLNSFEITEKIDGAALTFGFDEKGFYTSREGKAKTADRIRKESDYKKEFSTTGFRAAHEALKKLTTPLFNKGIIKEGDSFNIEVLFGKLPNAVPYSGDINRIIFLGKGEQEDPNEDRVELERINKALANKSITVSLSNVPYTEDGIHIQTKSESYNWEVSITPTVNVDRSTKHEVYSIIEERIQELEKFLKDIVELGDITLTNQDLISLPLNKKPDWLGNKNWKEVKERIAPVQQAARDHLMTYKLEIKDSLLTALVRGTQSAFGPSIDDGGWIEGVVLKDRNNPNKTFKLVDKEGFTSLNKYNWLVRNEIANTAIGNSSVIAELKRNLASLLGHPAVMSTSSKKYILGFGATPEEQIKNMASTVKLNPTKKEMLGAVDISKNKMEQLRKEYMNKEGKFKDLKYAEGVHERTLQSLASATKLIDDYKTALDDATTPEDLVAICVGNKIKMTESKVNAVDAVDAGKRMIVEGGNAVENVGAIHDSEIDPTLEKVAAITKLNPNMLKSNCLGSVHKAEFCGDIDIALDDGEFAIDEVEGMLILRLGEENVNRKANVISFKMPIVNFDNTKTDPKGRKRTGFVQVDFMFGNANTLKFGYTSAGDKSKYKGVYRTMLLMATASGSGDLFYIPKTEELIGRFGPFFSPALGINIRAKMRKRKSLTKADMAKGIDPNTMPYLKGEAEVDREEFAKAFPNVKFDKFGTKWKIQDPKEIAEMLFGDVKSDVKPEDLDSFEQVLELVRLKQNSDLILKIYKDNLTNAGMEIPAELN